MTYPLCSAAALYSLRLFSCVNRVLCIFMYFHVFSKSGFDAHQLHSGILHSFLASRKCFWAFLGPPLLRYDSSVLKQVDDTTFYLKHDRETNEKEVTQMLQLMADKETQVEAADKSPDQTKTGNAERR